VYRSLVPSKKRYYYLFGPNLHFSKFRFLKKNFGPKSMSLKLKNVKVGDRAGSNDNTAEHLSVLFLDFQKYRSFAASIKKGAINSRARGRNKRIVNNRPVGTSNRVLNRNWKKPSNSIKFLLRNRIFNTNIF